MAAKAPAALLKLVEPLKRQCDLMDLNKLLDAATTFPDWTVISNDEKREIESQSSKQGKLDRLMTLIAENGRVTQFANFIYRYSSPIPAAALAVMSTASTSEMRPKEEPRINQLHSLCRPEKTLQQPNDSTSSSAGGSQKSSANASTAAAGHGTSSPMEIDTTESPEASSMDTDSNSKENLCAQYDSLSNSSQESPDFGYHSGSSKDFQSQNQSAGGDGKYPFFQSPQENLKVIQKNQRSRQRELKRLDVTKHQHNLSFHQSTVVVNHNYHISPNGDLERQVMPQWLHPVMDHCPDIVQTLNMEMLTPHLMQNGLLTCSEYQQLEAMGTPWKQAKHFLLSVLPTKGEEGWKRFLKCLKEEKEHRGHQDLFQQLENAYC